MLRIPAQETTIISHFDTKQNPSLALTRATVPHLAHSYTLIYTTAWFYHLIWIFKALFYTLVWLAITLNNSSRNYLSLLDIFGWLLSLWLLFWINMFSFPVWHRPHKPYEDFYKLLPFLLRLFLFFSVSLFVYLSCLVLSNILKSSDFLHMRNHRFGKLSSAFIYLTPQASRPMSGYISHSISMITLN